MNARLEKAPNAPEKQAVETLFEEVRRLKQRMRALTDKLHADIPLTGGMLGVLRDIDRYGPRTVPNIARSRWVSRQHIQSLVNKLLELGDVELVANPAHKRSHLVALSAQGQGRVEGIKSREHALWTSLEVDAKSLAPAVETLSTLQKQLEALLHD